MITHVCLHEKSFELQVILMIISPRSPSDVAPPDPKVHTDACMVTAVGYRGFGGGLA